MYLSSSEILKYQPRIESLLISQTILPNTLLVAGKFGWIKIWQFSRLSLQPPNYDLPIRHPIPSRSTNTVVIASLSPTAKFNFWLLKIKLLSLGNDAGVCIDTSVLRGIIVTLN